MYYLIEIEYKIQLTDIVEILIEHLNKIMYSLQIAQVIIIYVHAYAEVQTCIPSVHYFKVSKLENKKILG